MALLSRPNNKDSSSVSCALDGSTDINVLPRAVPKVALRPVPKKRCLSVQDLIVFFDLGPEGTLAEYTCDRLRGESQSLPTSEEAFHYFVRQPGFMSVIFNSGIFKCNHKPMKVDSSQKTTFDGSRLACLPDSLSYITFRYLEDVI